MVVINRLITLLSQEPTTLDVDGYVQPTTRLGEDLLEKLKEELVAFTHPHGNNLSDSRLLQLRQFGFEFKLVHDDESEQICYAVKISSGWVKYTKEENEHVGD